MILSTVVLPQPLGPRTETNSCAATLKLTPSRVTIRPSRVE